MISSILSNRFARNPWQERMDEVLEQVVLDYGQDQSAAGSTTLEDISNDLAEQVRSEGVVLLPGAVTGELLENVRKEFRQIIDTSSNSPYVVDEHEGAVCVRVLPRSSFDVQSFPAISAFLDSYVFREIARCFYRPEAPGFSFNNTVFVHETPETTSPLSGKLHWDRTQALKFWLYVDDVPLEAGPMRIHPGSTERNKSERIERRQKSEQLEGGKDNVVSAKPEETRFLTGPAGTILLHDSDCSHGASPVSNGHVRRIIRGHCRAMRPAKSSAISRLLLNPESFHRC